MKKLRLTFFILLISTLAIGQKNNDITIGLGYPEYLHIGLRQNINQNFVQGLVGFVPGYEILSVNLGAGRILGITPQKDGTASVFLGGNFSQEERESVSISKGLALLRIQRDWHFFDTWKASLGLGLSYRVFYYAYDNDSKKELLSIDSAIGFTGILQIHIPLKR